MKKKLEIPKIYFVSNGTDGKEILAHLKSLGGKNIFYGADYTMTFRWSPKHFDNGDYCYINKDGEICLSIYKPEGYKSKKLE